MLYSVLLVTFVLCSGLKANPASISVNFEETGKKFEPILESRCLKYADANAYRQLKTSIDNFLSCVEENSRPATNQGDAFNMVCTEERQAGYYCLQDLLRKLEPCLDTQEKYLPNFLLGGHNRTFDQACEDISRIQDTVLSVRFIQCDPSLTELGQVLIASCLPKMRCLKILSNSDYLLTKSNVCGDINTIKKCLSNKISAHCTNGENLIDYITSSIDPYLVPCDANSIK